MGAAREGHSNRSAATHTVMHLHMLLQTAPNTSSQKCHELWYLLQPLDLHVVSVHHRLSVGVEQGSGLNNGHGLVVVHSKHVVEVRHGRQVTGRPVVGASDSLSQLAVLWQGIRSPRVLLQSTSRVLLISDWLTQGREATQHVANLNRFWV